MDTTNNSSGQVDTPSEANSALEGALTPSEFENDEQSGLRETLQSIPWGKILLGAIVLFLIIWGLVVLFSGDESAPITDAPVAIEESKKTIAVENAAEAASLLGQAQYNAIMQPNFSVDENTIITANEPRIGLLQASSVLEQTLNFDVFAYLVNESDKAAGLRQYENKLNQGTIATEQWLLQAAARLKELAAIIANNTQTQAQLLREVNTILTTDPASTLVQTQYSQFVETANQLAVFNTEQTLLTQIIRQVNPLLKRAEIRKSNIALNREALIQGIRVVDLDDPGLKLVVDPD